MSRRLPALHRPWQAYSGRRPCRPRNVNDRSLVRESFLAPNPAGIPSHARRSLVRESLLAPIPAEVHSHARRSCSAYTAFLLLFFFASCARKTPAPPADVQPTNESRSIDYSAWAAALSQAWAGDAVNYDRLREDGRPLQRFLTHIAEVGPNRTPGEFPDANSRLAFAINCYNAVTLASRLDKHSRFRVDGQATAPADLRRQVLALAAADWRVRFALYDPSSAGPPLLRRPFLPDMLDAQLDETVRTAWSSPRVVAIDHGEKKQLLLWRGLFEIKGPLIREYEQRYQTSNATMLNVLLERSDPARRELLNSAIGYDVAVLPERALASAQSSPPKR